MAPNTEELDLSSIFLIYSMVRSMTFSVDTHKVVDESTQSGEADQLEQTELLVRVALKRRRSCILDRG